MTINAIGISTAALYPSYLTEDALTASAEMGFRIVEVFLQADEEYTLAFAAELDQRRQALELEVHSLHLYATYFDMWATYPRMRKEARSRFLRTLEIAHRLQVRAITWHGLRYNLNDPTTVAAFFESAAWAAEHACAAGIVLCIENVSWCYLRQAEHVRTLIKAGLPIGFTFDTFQAGESETDPTALIQAMNTRLATVHVADYAPGAPRHLLPGDGYLDWRAIVHALKQVGYSGPLILETAGVTDPLQLLRARDFLLARLTAENAPHE